MRKKIWKNMRPFVIALVVFNLIGVALLTLLQRRILFPRHAAQPLPFAGQGIAGLERIWLDTEEGRVEAWLIPGDGVSAERPGPAVVFTHGNAELIDYWPEELAGYRKLGATLLLAEYRGYGRSAGSPSQEKITADLVRFFDLLAERPEVDADRIVLHGRSLGGGAACALAAERKPRALILQSTFTSITAMAKKFLVPAFLVRDSFDSLTVVSHIDVPVLVIHGRRDEVVPFAHGKRLAEAAREGLLIAYDCDHNSCPPDATRYWKDVADFLRRAGVIRGVRSR